MGDDDGTVTLFDTETRAARRPPPRSRSGLEPRLRSRGRLARDRRKREPGPSSPDTSKVWDADTARERSSASLRRHPAGAGLEFFPITEIDPDRRALIVTYSGGDLNRTTGVWLRDLTPGTPSRSEEPSESPRALPARPPGRFPVGACWSDGRGPAVDAETLRVVRRSPVGALTNGLADDGRTLAIEDVEGSLGLLDLH